MYELSQLAPVPIDEPCARIGSADYDARSTVECHAFRRMLERLFPVPDEADAFLVIRQFPHEFGMYREVCVKYRGRDGRAYRGIHPPENVVELERHQPPILRVA